MPAPSSSPSATPCAAARSTSSSSTTSSARFDRTSSSRATTTWPDLMDYCRRSANPVGRLVLRISGYRDDRLDAMSDAICSALQLTNFWQDLAIDWQKGRIYVPQAEIQAAGAHPADLGRRRISREWRAALTRAAAETRALFLRGRPLPNAVSGRLRWELRATWLGGMRILDRLERSGFDVFRARPTLGWLDAMPIGWRALMLALTHRTPCVRPVSISRFFPCRARGARPSPPSGISAAPWTMPSIWKPIRRAPDSAMDAWRADIARMFDGRAAETPEARALQPFVAPFNLPRAQFDALVDGVSMDIDPIRYQTFEDLQPYCHRVASAVGLICAEIFGYRDRRVLDYARDLGVALQLTNILRDVAVDYRRERLYLPLDDLARFGCTRGRRRQRGGPCRRRREVGCRALGPRTSGGTRARLLRSRRPRPAARRREGVHRRRDHARDLLGHPPSHRGGRVRRVQPRHSCAAAGPGEIGHSDVAPAEARMSGPADRVVVIGAGFAGLAAAVRLAHAGREVVVVEEAPRLGGRATAFTDRESGERVDNGQHVLFGCYRETYAFLGRLGTAVQAPLQPRLRLVMVGGDGRRSTLECPNLPAPWHLVAGVMRWSALGAGDRCERREAQPAPARRAPARRCGGGCRRRRRTSRSPPGSPPAARRRGSAIGSGIRWRSPR